jgi:hypothetical protein
VNPGDYVKLSTDPDIFYTKVRTIVDNVKIILETEYPVGGGGLGDLSIWSSPQLEVAVNGDRDETEIISFNIQDFSNPAQAIATEVYDRIIQELQLSKVETVVNDSKIKLISYLENSGDSKMQVLGGQAAVALGYSTVSPITGPLTVSAGNKKATGDVTSKFLSELQEGQWIKIDAHPNGSWTKIETIEDDQTLYFVEGYRGLSTVSATASKINFSELAEGQNQDYVLNRSNGQIELTTPLVAGDNLTAGSENTRAFVDSLQETFDFSSLGASSSLVVRVDGGQSATVDVGDGTAPFNTFISSDLEDFDANFFVGFHIECVSGNNIGEVSYVTAYDNSTGQIVTMGFTLPILAGDKFKLSQVLIFDHALDFSDPANVSSAEVITAINSQLLGAKASEKDDTSIRVRTSNFSEEGSIQVINGSANNVLFFSEDSESSQKANLSFLVSQNTDRDGVDDSLGYTLAPNQTLAIILNGDSANSTFSVPMSVTGKATAGGTLAFSDSALVTNYDTDNYFKDWWIFWTTGNNEGSLHKVTSYNGTTGAFTSEEVFNTLAPTPTATIAVDDEFSLVPRTAENVEQLFQDLNTTTFSISGNVETLGISGDYLQLSTLTNGSTGKVLVAGGTANELGITIESLVSGGATNDVNTNSRAGLTKGLPVKLTVDATVTVGDTSTPYDTFIAETLISTLPNYFTGMDIEFVSGLNESFKTTVSSYDNVTGQIVLADAATNSISVGDRIRISLEAIVKDLQNTTAPYIVSFVDISNTEIDVSGFTPGREAVIRDWNGFNFSTTQVEGIDGYKHYTGLVQLAQITIDGLDSDPTNFPGIGAAGTQFEVIPPLLVKIQMILDVTPAEGISLSSVSSDVLNSVSEYINSRKVGEDVILSEVIAAAQSVTNVYDVEVTSHTDNITIADGSLARIDESDLVIG